MIRKLTTVLLILAAANGAFLFLFPRLFYNYIVIHHSGTRTGNYETIRSFHEREHHWSDAGYHLILSNGTSGVPPGHLEATGRYRNAVRAFATQSTAHNYFGIHVCIIGDYSRSEVPPELAAALGNCIRELQHRFWIPDDRIVFHRDVGATECPGIHITHEDVIRWKDAGAHPPPASVLAQQSVALDEFTLGLTGRPRIRHAVLAALNAAVLACLGAVFALRRWRRRRTARQRRVPETNAA